MTRSLWLFNLLLALLSLGLLGVLADSIFDGQAVTVAHRPAPVVHAQSGEARGAEDGVFSLRPRASSLSDFDVILRQDPFRNPVVQTRPKPVVERPRPTLPLPTLRGTIFVGEERRAVLRVGNRDDIFSIGQPVGGGTLVKIEADRVTIRQGERLAVVPLKAPRGGKRPSAGRASASASASQPSGVSQATTRSEQARQKALRRAERIRKARERLLQRQRRLAE